MEGLLPFGPGAWLFIGIYLLSMLLVGWFGFRARRENTLKDFYVAGKGFGFFVLLMTLFATNTAATPSTDFQATLTGSVTPGS